MTGFRTYTHHPLLAQPGVAMGLSALSLLLLVLVLLSVPGPIKGLYWFSVPAENGATEFTAGVLGWCEAETSNCTYAALSENQYLSSLIDTGMALTTRIMLPLACYWSIVVLVFWVLLAVTTPMGYKINDLDSISRHLRFAAIEACVLCVTLFGNVLCWLAFGLGRETYLTIRSNGGRAKSGRAIETTAVAALMSLFAFFAAIWGLHLRMQAAQSKWKGEAVMVRRRSMAISAAGGLGGNRASALGVNIEKGSSRWGDVPDYGNAQAVGQSQRDYRGSMIKDPGYTGYSEEERLDAELEAARRNSRDQEMMVRRASMLAPNDDPYHAANRPA